MMKLRFTLLLFSFLLLCGCYSSAQHSNAENTKVSRDIFAMDTYMSLSAYGKAAETALDTASERILSLEKTLSVTDSGSDTWAINHADGEAVIVSDDTLTLIRTALNIGAATDGALDITLYPVLLAWGFTGETFQIPDSQTLQQLLKLVDFRQISIQENRVQLPAGMMIDFGALAKGYTGDCVIEILKEYGITSALINLGGNVQVLGSKPDGSAWKIAIQHPFASNEDLCVLEVTDKAVITSGSYERYFTGEDGKQYWHILDSQDGRPAGSGLVSVSVISEKGILCDALSTALFVMGKEAAIDFWREKGDFDMILVTDNKEIYYTQGLADSLQILSSMKSEVIYRK